MQKEKKKNTQWSIDLLGECQVDKIKEEILSFSNEWFLDTSRQEIFKTHKDTQMFQLRYMDYEWQPGNTIDYKDVNSFNSIQAQEQVSQIFNKLESHFDGRVVRAEVIKMLANTEVKAHVDGGNMLYVSRRCHVPIITNKDVFFTVMNNTINMEEGKIYEINNGMPHAVKNSSNIDRVHLILDILSNRYF